MSQQYPEVPDKTKFPGLKDNVVVVTGGASGIGASLVTIAYQHGAHVVLGDVNRDTGEALVRTLQSSKPDRGQGGENGNGNGNENGSLTFLVCDVRKYSDMYALFRTAWDTHGRVDHAVFCAGVVDSLAEASYFDRALTVDTVGHGPGDMRAVEVNFLATCAFARIALPFLRGGHSDSDNDSSPCPSPSLTFLSSVTGFRDAPGMFLYQTSKQAVLGLMRAMRTAIFERDGIRVNAVCPGMTDTPMTAASGMISLFKDRTPQERAELPSHHQSSAAVAEHIAAVMLSETLYGKSIYAEEGKGWEFEDGLIREMPRWLGEEPTRWSNDNLAFLAHTFGGS
jgi:NAD(P)-dependent dehydrogenase (short-subunit alcohol dehydrogenase family)